ncbi:MAG: putative baseplate assembly protein [Candidatus Methylomirabilales bacterium]
MQKPVPTLDRRRVDELVKRLKQLARGTPDAPGFVQSEWTAQDVTGMVMVRLFARMMELALERLNRVPEKNLVAFLDMMGVGLLPPGPARAPVTFALAPTARASGFVPKGTQVATVQSETQSAVVFETEKNLVVTATRLITGYSVNPNTDRYSNRTATITGQEKTVFAPFEGDRLIEHILYMGGDPLLMMQRTGQLILEFQLESVVDRIPLESLLAAVLWEAFKEGRWQSLRSPTFTPLTAPQVDAFTLTFPAFAGAEVTELSGPGLPSPLSSRWVRGRLAKPITQFLYTDFAQITAIGADVQVRPALTVLHLAGAVVTKMDVLPTPPPTLSNPASQGTRTIQLTSGEGLEQGDIVMIEDGNQTEFVTLGIIPRDPGPVTIPVAPSLRFNHVANRPLRKITLPATPITTTLAADASAGSTTLSLASAAGLEINDVVSFRASIRNSIAERLNVDAVTARVEQMTPQGISPDQVHVNTAAVDFTKDFYPLGDNPKAGDTFYVASTEALSKVEPTLLPEERGRVELNVEINVGDAMLKWEYFGGVQGNFTWTTLEVDDRTRVLTHDGTVVLPPPDLTVPNVQIPLTLEQTVTVAFFRISIDSGTYQKVPYLRVFRVSTRLPDGRVLDFTPTIAFTSETPLDVVDPTGQSVDLIGLTRVDLRYPFYPFGLSPAVGNTFYFGIAPEGLVTLQPHEPRVMLTHTVRFVWEFLSQDGWKRLGESSTREASIAPAPAAHNFSDHTRAFARRGTISFRRPPDLAPGEVNGQSNYWIRARLVSGVYGRPAEFIPVDPADPSKGFRQRPGTGAVNAPVISRIALNYTAESRTLTVVTQNQFVYENQTSKNTRGDNLFYKPFEPVEEKPTFYLGFNAPFENRPVDLYVSVPPRQVVEELGGDPPEAAEALGPKVVWEYWNGRDWTELVVVDETRALTESGSVQFLGPTDFTALTKFVATPLYWIRARREQPAPDYFPILRGVFLNTVRAVQATTIANELVGSSNGRPNQTFRLFKSPVQPGQRLVVREPERPSAEDEAQILEEEGPDAIQTKEGPGGVTEYWVRWHEVKSLRLSGPRSRHYTLERATGEIRFGDGVRGMIPPQGTDNIMCESYRAGGGGQGNQSAAAISQLKSSLPAIASVANPEAADGGSERETTDVVQERGPQTLRHRDRSVAVEDFEWLARQAVGTRVARAKCLPNRNRQLQFEPGWTTVILVPQGREKKLLPSAELIRQVEDFFAERAPATLVGMIPARINVIGPGYVPVEVEAEIKPVSFGQADVVRRRVLDRLDRFFHTLMGGPEGKGWEFGRDVFLSELFAALEGLEGVEHVHSLRFKPIVATMPLVFKFKPEETAPTPTQKFPVGSTVTVRLPDGTTFTARLAEPFRAGEPVQQAMVIVFREGERIRLSPPGQPNEAVLLTIRAISGNTLTVDPFLAQVPFPVGSEVASADGRVRSTLKTAVAQGALTSFLTVQGFEIGQTVTINGLDGPLSLATLDGNRLRLHLGERLRVGEHYLVYSGVHTITIVPE